MVKGKTIDLITREKINELFHQYEIDYTYKPYDDHYEKIKLHEDCFFSVCYEKIIDQDLVNSAIRMGFDVARIESDRITFVRC